MRIVWSIIIVVAVISCNSDEEGYEEVTPEEKGETVVPDMIDTCKCAVLTDSVTSDSSIIKLKKGIPFNGKCYSLYPETDTRYEEHMYIDGVIQSITYFGKDGKVLVVDKYEDGKRIQNVTNCDCTEIEYKEIKGENLATLNGKPYTGHCVSYYPGLNQPYMEEDFEDGKKHGNTIIYDKQGKILSFTRYENGEKISSKTY